MFKSATPKHIRLETLQNLQTIDIRINLMVFAINIAPHPLQQPLRVGLADMRTHEDVPTEVAELTPTEATDVVAARMPLDHHPAVRTTVEPVLPVEAAFDLPVAFALVLQLEASRTVLLLAERTLQLWNLEQAVALLPAA